MLKILRLPLLVRRNLLQAHKVVFLRVNRRILASFILDQMLKLQERALEQKHGNFPLIAFHTVRGCIRRKGLEVKRTGPRSTRRCSLGRFPSYTDTFFRLQTADRGKIIESGRGVEYLAHRA